MTTPAASPLSQINLYNLSLLPTREIFSARLIVAWVAVAIVLMLAVGWWAILETRSLSREVANTAAYQAAEKARTAPTMIDGEALPTPEQVAARELVLRNQQALLEARRAARDVLKRGVADEKGGPSVLMRAVASSAPPQAWLTEVRVAGGHIDLAGKTLDPLAVTVWLDKLRTSGLLAAKPLPAVRVERVDLPQTTPARPVSVYSFAITATLSSPFAEDGTRP